MDLFITLSKLLVDSILKISLLIGLAACIFLPWYRRVSAAARSQVWTFVLLAVICIPVFTLLLPSWQVPLIPDVEAHGNPGITKRLMGVQESSAPSRSTLSPLEFTSPVPDLPGDAVSEIPVIWSFWVLVAWACGAAIIAAWQLTGQMGIWRITRESEPLDEEWHSVAQSLAGKMGISRSVRLFSSTRIQAAMTKGVWRPEIIVPGDSPEWSEQRRRIVLIHELAHIRRRDMLIEAIAKVAGVVFWCNPLVWWVIKRIRIERERACDDIVLSAGLKPSEYALELMSVAADLGVFRRPVWQSAAISEGSGLKNRLLCILDPKVNRNFLSRFASILLGLSVFSIVPPLSSLSGWMPSPYPYSVKKVSINYFSSLDDVLVGLVNPSAEVRASAFQKLDSMPRDKMCQIVETAIHFPKKSVSSKTLDLLASKDRHRVESLLKNMAVMADDEVKGRIEYELKRLQKTRTLNDYLNEMGYELLKKGEIKQAIDILETNVKLHPQSSNAYDSLGEAYFKAKKLDLATKFYEKSLKLNPDNSNASSRLKMIKKVLKKTIMS